MKYIRYARECKSLEGNLVMGDFNAYVGRGRHTGIVGNEGLGEMNRSGEKLTELWNNLA